MSARRRLNIAGGRARHIGSGCNKLLLVPGALLISAVIPWLITPLLMCGGAFLCYEGFEKLVHGLRAIELWIGNAAEHTLELPRVGSVLGGLTPTLMSTAFGVLAGGLIFAVLTLSKRFLRQGSTQQ